MGATYSTNQVTTSHILEEAKAFLLQCEAETKLRQPDLEEAILKLERELKDIDDDDDVRGPQNLVDIQCDRVYRLRSVVGVLLPLLSEALREVAYLSDPMRSYDELPTYDNSIISVNQRGLLPTYAESEAAAESQKEGQAVGGRPRFRSSLEDLLDAIERGDVDEESIWNPFKLEALQELR